MVRGQEQDRGNVTCPGSLLRGRGNSGKAGATVEPASSASHFLVLGQTLCKGAAALPPLSATSRIGELAIPKSVPLPRVFSFVVPKCISCTFHLQIHLPSCASIFQCLNWSSDLQCIPGSNGILRLNPVPLLPPSRP